MGAHPQPSLGSGRWSGLEPALLLVAALAYPLDWHLVHQTTALDLRSVFCAMTPDCHPGPPEPVHDTGVTSTCPGFTHDRFFLVPILLVLLGVCLAVTLQVPHRAASARWVALLFAALLVPYSVFIDGFLTHMFDRTETLPPAWLFRLCATGLAVASASRLVSAWRARRARAGQLAGGSVSAAEERT